MIQPEAVLERIAALADEWKFTNLQPQIAACRNLLQACNGIDVAVFGRFKAGKSSFLNHLIGRNVLPIGVVPLTAVITRLRYGESDHAAVSFLDNTTETIPFSDIHLYVGENENPDNRKKVAAVEVALPELKPLAPLQFVDTPGLGSAFTHNTEVALNWLPNVGAALVAVSSDAPLSERDLALLNELRRYTPKIVLLLTKADLLYKSQQTEVLNFVRQRLHGKWDGNFPVFFYSIKPEMSVLKTELEQNLLLPLVRHCNEAAGQILHHKLSSLVTQTLNYLQVALAAATQAESARQALREKLAEERRQFDLLRTEINVLSRKWSADALDEYLVQLLPTLQALQDKITTGLRGQFPLWNLRLPPLLDDWREWTGNFLKSELGEVSCAQQAMFCEPLQKARAHLTRALHAFHNRLAEHVKSALGVTLTPHEFTLEMRTPTVPPVDVGYIDAAFSLVSFAIPMTLFRRSIEHALLRKARWEAEKNLSRLAVAWRDRMVAGINELTRQAEKQALDELAALEQMLSQTKSSKGQLHDAIADLRAANSCLQSSGLPSVARLG